jgi:integrase/recombinase XerD
MAPADVPYAFLSRRNTALMPLGLDKLLHRLRDQAGITGIQVSPHTFRHSMAVNFLEAGGDVFRLSRLLGHEDITTTQGYLRAFRARANRDTLSVFDRVRLPPVMP